MILDEIAAYLSVNAVGTVGTDIFKSLMPEDPDFAIGIFEYAGRPSDKSFGTTIQIENARFQVLVRSDRESTTAGAYSAARSKARDVHLLLDGKGALALSGVDYLFIEALHPPFFLQRDENERVLIACNYEARKRPG